jgi:hypothetical protein
MTTPSSDTGGYVPSAAAMNMSTYDTPPAAAGNDEPVVFSGYVPSAAAMNMSTYDTPPAAAGNDEPVVVNRTRYNRDYVKACMDNADIQMHNNFKDAAEALKRGLENLKLYPDHKVASIKKSKRHEEKADDLFKANEFANAYFNYQKAIDALMVTDWKLACCLAFSIVICLTIVCGNDAHHFLRCCVPKVDCSKALPKQQPDDK